MVNEIDLLEFKKNMQIIVVNCDGVITYSDENLFKWKENQSIFKVHPFFEIINNLKSTEHPTEKSYTFDCVKLGKASKEKICDVRLKFSSDNITITIFDYTVKYENLTKVIQINNDTILENKKLELENKLLIEKEEFKNSFIANISHNIRTPLTGIFGFTEILEKTSLTYEQEELIKIIKRESTHLNAMIYDMLDISKIEAGRIKPKEEKFNLKTMLLGIEKKYNYLIQNEEKDIVFNFLYDTEIQEDLFGDEVRLRQILVNILNNAFNNTTKGSIDFNITKNYQRGNKVSVNFSIKDTGKGIPQDSIKYAFERFSKFNEDKEATGTGLGLAIAKNLVELLGGKISIESELGTGTTIIINLSFKFDLLNREVESKGVKQYNLPKSDRKFRVLLVEDKEINQYLITKMLVSDGNFFMDVANNGDEAIKYIERKNYDVIIMDIMMSPTDGYQATAMIRNNYGDKTISNVPIIGFTAKAIEGEREKCLKAGMNDFITKPFKQEDLINKIYKQISKNYKA